MTRKRYLIEIDENLTNTVYYPTHLKKTLKGTERIAFGSRSCEAHFKENPVEKSNTIVVSSDIKESLLFTNISFPIHLFHDSGTLYLGPLVGIITSGFTPFPLRPIGDRTLFFSKLLSVQKSVGAVPFVFGDQHINWEQGLIEGYFYSKNGWEKRLVPFPNVIYDRLPNRKSENQKAQRTVKTRLQTEYLIPWYNPGFFNKLDIYDLLYNDEKVYEFLPETHPFTNYSNIENMLTRYGHVYIKPINGSLGLGVHHLVYDKKENSYYCRYLDLNREKKLQKFSSLEQLINHVFSKRPLDKMLVQQGVSLLRSNNRAIDFRIHTNKDADGKWRVSAMAAKVAGSGSVTTHVNSGGEIKTMDEIFNNEEKSHYIPKLKDAALKLSHSLERHMDGIIAEIGFDLGIDKNGKVWLFEANSKPGRSIFNHPQLKEFDVLTRSLSIAYAIFLTEKSIHEPEEIFR